MTTSPATNGFDQAQVRDLVGQIEEHLAELLSERGAYMVRCRTIRKGIADVYEDAKEKGLPKRALRNLIRTREFERKIEASIAALEDDDRHAYEMLEEALGDFGSTPLGGATLDRAKGESGLDALKR